MDNSRLNKYYLLIKLDKIKFAALDQKNKIIFSKKIIINNLKSDRIFESLKNFLDQNIIKCEKKLKTHIKDIILIIEDKSFLNIDVSSIKNYKNYLNQNDNISNFLIDLKNDFKKDMINYQIVHLIINKYIINGKNYFSITNEQEQENIFLEIRFICLELSTYLTYKKILSKYQISVKNVLCYEYVNNFKISLESDIFDMADKLLGGHNKNEILLISKTIENKGFFEKFFNFFN